MKLVNCDNLKVEHFVDQTIPPYAVLSHTWTSDEVTFEEMRHVNPSSIIEKFGFHKIMKSCEWAKKDGLNHIWVDTCCIDKSSSAELSEAINSMYRWYREAEVCYAFLSDVPASLAFIDGASAFDSSHWYTRGWTLQELLAPSKLVFISAEWESLGTKAALAGRISKVTGIPEDILTGRKELQSASIAQRMSWASARETTRIEDVAYCLMGIFEINMPMLYGEGEKAFLRLQEEIVKVNEDHSIFAWENNAAEPEQLCGLLAPHPRCFRTTGNFASFLAPDSEGDLISVTNRGISLKILLHATNETRRTAMFECTESNQIASFAFIDVVPIDEKRSKYARVNSSTLGRSARRGFPAPITIRQQPRLMQQATTLRGQQWFRIKTVKMHEINSYHSSVTLDRFLVSPLSAIRPLATDDPTAQPLIPSANHEKSIWQTSDVTRHLFQTPNDANTIAVTLQVSVEDDMGFGSKSHANINLGMSEGATLAISAVSLGETTEEEVQERAVTAADFVTAKKLPAAVSMKVEHSLVVSGTVDWEDLDGESVVCVSLEIGPADTKK